MSIQVDHSKPLTDEEKQYFHAWSMDYVIEENERIHGTPDDTREGVNTPAILSAAGILVPPQPAQPLPAGQELYTGPVVVEGENDVPPAPGELSTRVPLPRDHPLTGLIDEAQDAEAAAAGPLVGDEWDDDAQWVEVCELTVPELKDNLRELDQPVGGNQGELRTRLYDALKAAHQGEEG